PRQCLPVMLDVGTANVPLREDPLYLGYPHPRLTGEPYFSLVEEFVAAVQDKFPRALIQFEDFLTPNAYALLHRYRDRVLCFNDDIQGTAAVALAGVYASTRLTDIPFSELRIMFLGAGSAATGIGDLMVTALEAAGLDNKSARERLWFSDIDGLIVASRDDLQPHNVPYAHEHEHLPFVDALRAIKPHVLIGATGAPGTFTQDVIATMAALNARPAIFALSNPTSRAECTAEQAYAWSEGRAIFTSGSPFEPVKVNGDLRVPGQGNNAYIFPGIGLGAVACEARTISDAMFLRAARTLADQVTAHDLERGTLYPPLANIRRVSHAIAVAVAEQAFAEGTAGCERPDDLAATIENRMYQPDYSRD
ncbi:MAG: oxaloacetate-decarboxylating malate dehydrogenase, partial [Pseudomonadota bacterium]